MKNAEKVSVRKRNMYKIEKSRKHSKITPQIKFETTFLFEKCRKKAGEIKGGGGGETEKRLPNCTEKINPARILAGPFPAKFAVRFFFSLLDTTSADL